eukprot:CAMPEP_0113325492 /NCGR_PEP_ID=MMETSP0010_2-20120614/17809_1 /TAXON_ID=216773 ORGANISM="Corethron hystrix, Strain 308" /NCGR_SAMPLE_ID=MMETSP0010_2 /ASSEMBLY_ACC=CAM_ASM_000155 /LENGTH=130 /DNA_ID=CAMNT_0000185345 /DNA_START=704 /DNA_END=1092 /DNA_ORIENTATION=- /assembly_acc=CAM_ASM_000155
MAPIMAAFAAGTALGPAIGGLLVESIGVRETFYVVGASYFALGCINSAVLSETQRPEYLFLGTGRQPHMVQVGGTLLQSFSEAVGQWAPLWSDSRVRNILVLNGLYWTGLAGSQMTVLPLLLTDPSGLAL